MLTRLVSLTEFSQKLQLSSFMEHTANRYTRLVPLPKKKRKKRGNKTSYTSKEDYAIFVARIVSSRKTKRSCVLELQLERQSSRIVLPIAFNLQRTSRGVEATRRKAPLKCRRGHRENPFPKGPKRLFRIDRDTCRL